MAINKRIIRIAETIELTGIPKSSIYALLKEGSFCRPVSISRRCVGFVESEVHEWIQSRIDARDAV